jgi:hypothetical protein
VARPCPKRLIDKDTSTTNRTWLHSDTRVWHGRNREPNPRHLTLWKHRLLSVQDAWVSGYKQTDPAGPPIFRTTRLQQRDHSFRHALCFPSVSIMALRRNVLQEDDILCWLYSDTRSDVSDYSDNERLDNDSDVPPSSVWQSQFSIVVVTSDSETSTIEEENS